MRLSPRLLTLLVLSAAISACDVGDATNPFHLPVPAVRVVNAFTAPVDVLLDGAVVIPNLAAGSIGTAAAESGNHTLVLRASSSSVSVSQSITTAAGTLRTIAVLRAANGAVVSAALDDTNSVVPAGATKLRVLHLAPNAGTLQVFRTQPDYPQPVSWQFPFTYQANLNSLSAPFYPSTPGSWEVRIWQTPVGGTGWDTAPVKVVVPLGSGERKTIVILDQPGGGVRVEIL